MYSKMLLSNLTLGQDHLLFLDLNVTVCALLEWFGACRKPTVKLLKPTSNVTCAKSTTSENPFPFAQ